MTSLSSHTPSAPNCFIIDGAFSGVSLYRTVISIGTWSCSLVSTTTGASYSTSAVSGAPACFADSSSFFCFILNIVRLASGLGLNAKPSFVGVSAITPPDFSTPTSVESTVVK